MKFKLAFLMLSCAGGLFATTAIVGFEDLFGSVGSDRDFSDVDISVTGLDFHATTPFHFVGYPPPGSSETPFPDGWFFDSVTVTGPVTVRFLSAESAYLDRVRIIDPNLSQLLDVARSGNLLNLPANLGDRLQIVLDVPNGTSFSIDAGSNGDGIPHSVVRYLNSPTPEPGTIFTVFLAIAIASCGRRLVKKEAADNRLLD